MLAVLKLLTAITLSEATSRCYNWPWMVNYVYVLVFSVPELCGDLQHDWVRAGTTYGGLIAGVLAYGALGLPPSPLPVVVLMFVALWRALFDGSLHRVGGIFAMSVSQAAVVLWLARTVADFKPPELSQPD